MSDNNLLPDSSIIDHLALVAKTRKELLERLKVAIKNNNNKEIKEVSRKLCGMKK